MIGRVNTGGGTGGTLTVTAPANVTVTVSKDGKTKTKNSGASGVVAFKGLASGTWTVTITGDGKTAQKNVVVTTDYSTAISFNTIPEFTYTGDYEIVNDSDEPITVSQGNWKIRFLTSGTLTFTNLNGAEDGIDVFLVGGGGTGGYGDGGSSDGGGGGGGYTKTVKSVSITTGTAYNIVIGASDGNTSAFNITAAHGARGGDASSGTVPGSGGAGGSGGGAGGEGGGSDGSNGLGVKGGKGQGTTTREFGESSGNLYAGGGSGGGSSAGGAGGGGAHNAKGSTNTGGGGGGKSWNVDTSAGAGGSGIAIIRNARGAA